MTVARRINLALLLILLGASVAVWPDLPDRLPLHFGLGGRVDRWADRSLRSWFTIPLVAVGLNLLLIGVARWATERPERINLPDKARLLRLPPERQRAVLTRLRGSFDVVALPLTLSMCFVQAGSYLAARGGSGQAFMILVFVIALLSGPLALIAILLPLQRELDRQHGLERDGRVTPEGSNGRRDPPGDPRRSR
jgi:hypothetical protein